MKEVSISLEDARTWCAVLIHGLIREGLDPALGKMFEQALGSPRQKVVFGIATEIAEMVTELPPAQRSKLIEEGCVATGVSPHLFLKGKYGKLDRIISSGSISNKSEFRLVQEALNDGLLVSTSAKAASRLLSEFIAAARRVDNKGEGP